MIDKLLSNVAPHLCCGCGKIGTLLCDNCKYNINSDIFIQCIDCGGPSGETGICKKCDAPYVRAWCVGERSGALQRLIGDFKFQNMRAAYRPLALLLLERLDELPQNTIVVPIPTVASHICERGYDHTYLLARDVAKARHIKMQPVLTRVTSTKQRGASRQQCVSQAKAAFQVTVPIDESAPYLLLDDVVTTGATITYAAYASRAAGVQQVWVAVIALQPLD